MPKVLLNYRREDSAPYAGRIADRLRQEFGPEQVFVDIDAIRPGEDFVDAIDRSLVSCDVLVAIIGKSWLSCVDDAGNRRLDRGDDFVRIEIGKALERRVRVIPTLVGGAVMPEAKDLPQDIAPLSRRQGIEISDGRFHQDVDRLIEALSDGAVKQVPAAPAAPQPGANATRMRFPPSALLIGIIVTALIAVAGYFALGSGSRTPSERETSGRGRIEESRQQPAGKAPQPDSAVVGPGAETERSAPSKDAPNRTAIPQAAGGRAPQPDVVGVVGPGAEIGRPAPSEDASGKTGIKVVWRGANSVPCYLYDAAGEKLLSPAGVIFGWHCEKDAGSWDAAPGRYQLKFGGVAGTIDPIPLTVTAGRVTAIEPQIGQLRLHWKGSNRVLWYLLDKTGEKTLSPLGVINAWDVEPGKSSIVDLGPGEYAVKVDAVGYQPVKVRIAAFRVTDVTIP